MCFKVLGTRAANIRQLLCVVLIVVSLFMSIVSYQ